VSARRRLRPRPSCLDAVVQSDPMNASLRRQRCLCLSRTNISYAISSRVPQHSVSGRNCGSFNCHKMTENPPKAVEFVSLLSLVSTAELCRVRYRYRLCLFVRRSVCLSVCQSHAGDVLMVDEFIVKQLTLDDSRALRPSRP